MQDVTTSFPEQIDSQLIFSDMRIKDAQLQSAYLAKIKSGAVDEAAEMLENSNKNYYGAYWYNMLNSRLYALENYFLDKERTERVSYQNEIPTDRRIWIGS
jgi:hypothetical protein